jgi:hypothetical protein
MTHLERFFAALYISEVWYSLYTSKMHSARDKIYGRTRGVVMFDRVMSNEYDSKMEK